jgi:hypothetical protein
MKRRFKTPIMSGFRRDPSSGAWLRTAPSTTDHQKQLAVHEDRLTILEKALKELQDPKQTKKSTKKEDK